MSESVAIPPQDRLIVALDVPTAAEARALAAELGAAVTFYKIGLELFMAGGYFELLEHLRAAGKKVMVDLKFFDVPRTVGAAVARLAERDVTFATVHGNDAILRAAAEAKGSVQILGVTVLTSLDQGDLDDLGFTVDVERLVLSRARRALEVGCDGVVCSGHELVALRRELPGRLLCVVPGIRPVTNREEDDQKRTVDVAEALRRGADYLVIGRPILQAPDRRAAAEAIQAQVRAAVG